MNIQELDAYNLDDAVKFNNHLNPRIWDKNEHLKPEVRERLLEIAADFKETLGIPDLDLQDITISGSNAAYTYTPNSDIDLHLVVRMPDNEVYRELFDAKKFQYNETHSIKIGGADVELYVEDSATPPVSQGMYSVLNDQWIQVPRRVRADVDDTSTRNKFETIGHQIEQAIKSKDSKRLEQMASKVKRMRQTGLEQHGEFGPENLAFKMLRSQGVLKKLHDALNTAKSQELSLRERKQPNSVFTYGFKHEAEHIKEPEITTEAEKVVPSDEEILKDFINFCFKELKIKQQPVIKLRRDPQWSVRNKTFGRYTNDVHTLEVAWGQRHIMDVLRTVAHELTHKHQHERDGERMGPDAGETGSPWENEANARAGILMRDYGRLHPELFDAGQTELEESASGYIPTKKQAKDPRYVMALTTDVQPGQVGKEANKLKLKTDRQGHPQVARANGLFEKLSLELAKFKKEDYSPDNPPGPESKPTMPKGTVRVDVSDMYDWYKLGQNISNLKGVDKSRFGKGPPSTIVSFGDEDTEHKYINDLDNLGLDVTDIDPKDPKKRPGRTIKTDPTYNVTESLLDEVRMAPSNLMQWAKSPEAQGVQAGFEAELIFRDTNSGDNDDSDMEPDYDMDERAGSIQEIIEFFDGGDYGGLSSRQRSALEQGLDEQYMEWFDEQMHASWRDERDELIREAWLQERPMSERIHAALVDGLDLTDEQADAVERLHDQRGKKEISGSELNDEQLEMASQYSEARAIADDILDEEVEQTIEKEDGFYDEVLDNFRGDFYIDDDRAFFDDVGLRYMSDVAEAYDLDWPYLMGSGSNGGERSWDSIGDSLADTIDMPVKVSSGYHSATRKPGLWIVEPDSSLDPDDREDYGLEIVSPPMPLLTALEKLQEVTDWANDSSEGNAYTNSSTGLHMGVSVPFKGGDVDYLKLVLFLGDEYVLQSFGREANTYTKSAMSKFRENIKGGRVDVAGTMKLMQDNLIELAQREVQKGVGEGKYTSAHIQKGYIEFRSAGGDWLAEESADPEKLQNTMLRYAYAMSLAANPGAERREYAKKLYKLLAPEGDDQLALFSQFTAGELDKEQLKKRWAEKTIGTEKKMNQRWRLYQNIDGRWEPVPGAEWNGYSEDQVKNAVWSKYGREALDSSEYQLVNMGEQSWEVYDVNTGKTLEIVKGKSKGEVADAVYDKYVDQGIGFQIRPYEDPATATPRAKLAKRIASAPKEEPQLWQVVNRKTGEVYDTVRGTKSGLGSVLRNFEKGEGIPQGDAVLKLAPEQTQQATNERGVPYWEIYEKESGHVVHTFLSDTEADAKTDAKNWLTSMSAEQPELFNVRPKTADNSKELAPAVAQNFNQPEDATNRVGTWAIYDVTLGREISRMENVPWSQADARANEFERSTGHNMSVRGLSENFADGKGPGRPGDSQRHGIPKGATIAQLEKAAKAPGRKGQLARWQLNMRRGKARAK